MYTKRKVHTLLISMFFFVYLLSYTKEYTRKFRLWHLFSFRTLRYHQLLSHFIWIHTLSKKANIRKFGVIYPFLFIEFFCLHSPHLHSDKHFSFQINSIKTY